MAQAQFGGAAAMYAITRLPSLVFAQLVPQLAAHPQQAMDLRDCFARWAAAPGRRFESWQQAWNEFIKPGGVAEFIPRRCATCHGRRYDVRAYARTGSAVCLSCHGTGKGSRLRLPANPAPVDRPAAAAEQ